MPSAIVTIDMIRAKARKAHADGLGREDHGMNWHAAALPTWHDEWDRCEVSRIELQRLEQQYERA